MTPGLVTVGFLHPGQYAACFADSLADLQVFDLCHQQRMAHPRGRVGNETGAAMIVAGRNQLARTFLDESDAEWLFMIDADMGFAPDTVERLIAAADPVERPVMGGLAFACKSDGSGEFRARRYRATPTLYRMSKSATEVGFVPMFDYPRNTVVKVAATGAACVLVHRDALERIRTAHGDRWFDPIELPKGDDGRTTFGEDMSFCLRLAACEIPIHVNTAVKTTHDKGGIFLDEETYDLQQAALGGRLVAAPLIDVVIPTYGRADRLADVAFNILATTANLHAVTFVVEADDAESITAVSAIPSPKVRCVVNDRERSYAGAINCAAATSEARWLFTGADDLLYHHGWDESALRLASATGAHVIGTNDLGHPAVLAGQHSTHSLVSSVYIAAGATAERIPGKVLHEYHHNYVDTELVKVAQARGVYAHCHASKVEHMHPIWGKSAEDDTYIAGAERFDEDRATFDTRMAAMS